MALTCVVDLIVLGGRVLTQDPARPFAEAFIVQDGVISGVGVASDFSNCVGDRLDLHGQTVLPGFIDAHAHPAEAGLDAGLVDLSAAATPSELGPAITDWAEAHPHARWIQGGGWDPTIFSTLEPIKLLDDLLLDRPIVLWSVDGHSAWVDSLALDIADLLTGPAPRGGVVERGADGSPTGVLREMAVDAVLAHVPSPKAADVDAAIVFALEALARVGVTTVVEAATEPAFLRGWRRAERAGTLTARVLAAVPLDPGETNVGTVRRLARRYNSDRLAVTAVKLFLDGVVESKTATMVASYTDGSNAPLQFTNDELDGVLAQAGALQVHAHAIGDGAVRQFLDAVERRPGAGAPVLAHVEFVDPADLPRFATLGVAADISALWAYPDAFLVDLTVPVVGAERAARAYPFGELAAAGATLIAGSDWDVSTVNPWPAIEVAVTRANPDLGGEVLGVHQELTLQAMLTAYTSAAAAVVAPNLRIGQISVGRRADFVVLVQDLSSVAPIDLAQVVVASTWLDGRQVYVRPSSL